jgi:hypothetical protein
MRCATGGMAAIADFTTSQTGSGTAEDTSQAASGTSRLLMKEGPSSPPTMRHSTHQPHPLRGHDKASNSSLVAVRQ